jgi:hypothetical protein
MRSTKTASIAPAARDWLMNSRYPRILHIFDSVCNLVNELREVLSIVTPQIGNGPFNLVVKDDVCFSAYAQVESPISISASQITIGKLVISISNSKFWNPCPDWKKLYANQKNIFNRLASLPVSFLEPSLPYPVLSAFSAALAMSNISTIQKITPQLAGLGNGLTPSGDDFLLGAIYATWIIHPPEVVRALAEAIATTAAPLTTSLSAAWLKAGARGQASELWHDFFKALLSSSSSAVQLQITKLLAVGHTSGADALAGFIGTMLCQADSIR